MISRGRGKVKQLIIQSFHGIKALHAAEAGLYSAVVSCRVLQWFRAFSTMVMKNS